MAPYRSTMSPARSLARSSSIAACTHRPPPSTTNSENGTKSSSRLTWRCSLISSCCRTILTSRSCWI
ncbi:hypothetical protein LINGRAHAP2_LOCUS20301 [Linum grandiflorum]